MKIIRRINHNAALALDGAGQELVVLGKGIGFPAVPYELTDLSGIQKTFYGVDRRYADIIAEIPQAVLLASADLVEQAEINLERELNPNVTFTLADHLHFAMERQHQGLNFDMPLSYDVEHLYPREYELGLLALDIVQDYTRVRLPEEEAVSVAMHLINAEAECGDMHETARMLKIVSAVDEIVEKELELHLSRESFAYSRFTMHLRYLLQRFDSGKQMKDSIGGMLPEFQARYPDVYRCTGKVVDYFRKEWSWRCTPDEFLYLMIHINRVKEKQEEYL